MNISFLENINTSPESYKQIIALYDSNKMDSWNDIQVVFDNWFAANMSAVLGAVLDQLQNSFNKITFDFRLESIRDILSKNGFLSHFGFPSLSDTNQTTVPYLKLDPKESRFFQNYITSKLLSRAELPIMSAALKKKIAESIYEIFVNAQIHSQTPFIYSCGQFYPQKHIIEFTVVDRGIGFKGSISHRFGKNLTSMQAIRWAVSDMHSTKIGVSGGLGLSILREFIQKNKGKFQIISGDTFYQYDVNGEKTENFDLSFPGSIINLQFRTDDSFSYDLSEDINPNDLF